MTPRCCNLDWLEVVCLEPTDRPRNRYFYEDSGFEVVMRDYGTRVWSEVFTLNDTHGDAFIEVRRAPKTSILSPNLCSLRLVNRYCYFDNAADLMQDFITRYGLNFQRIARVDICLDFERFDSGDDPYKFIVRYLNGTYSKINQANVHAHGTDRWDGRDFNSLSWGSPVSDIGTKLYDKTMELRDPITKHWKKPYIRQSWLLCGLIDDWQACTKHKADGTLYEPRIWRVEFSIRSSVKKWFVINPNGKENEKYSVRNTLDCYNSRAKLLTLFLSLAQHYFHFKYYYAGQRKDRCPDKVLFDYHNQQEVYKVGRDSVAASAASDRALNSLLNKLKDWRERSLEDSIKKACSILISSLETSSARVEAGSLVTHEEIVAFQLALKYKMHGDTRTQSVLLDEIKRFLKLNPNFF